MEAWIRLADDGENCILSKGGTQNRNYWVLMLPDGAIDFRWETPGGSNHGSQTSPVILDDEWHHVACVYDREAGENRIYVDGTLALSEPDSGTPVATSDPLLIGARTNAAGGFSDEFEGAIDLVRVSSSAIYHADFSPPLDDGVVGSTATVRVEWRAPATGNVTGYWLYRANDDELGEPLNALPILTNSYVDRGDFSGKACYRVSAIDEYEQVGVLSKAACLVTEGSGGVLGRSLDSTAISLGIRPQPMVDGAEIDFFLAREHRVLLRLFDVTGRRVATLLDDTRAPGPHSIFWNGQDSANRRVPAGVYFLRLDTSRQVQMRKVTILH